MIDVVHVIAYEFEGLYVDGKLRDQDHTISVTDLAYAAKGEPFTLKQVHVDEDWLMDTMELPENYSDVKLSR